MFDGSCICAYFIDRDKMGYLMLGLNIVSCIYTSINARFFLVLYIVGYVVVNCMCKVEMNGTVIFLLNCCGLTTKLNIFIEND